MSSTSIEPGHVYIAERDIGKKTVLVEKGELAQLLQVARLWWDHVASRLFFCVQCNYFASSAQAVQEHSEREHDCRYEIYETLDRYGAKRIRVRTVKCHSRAPLGGKPATKAWEGLKR